MRLLRFEEGGRAAAGVRIGDAVVPLAALQGLPDDPVAILAGGAALQAKVAAAAAASSVRRPLSGLKPDHLARGVEIVRKLGLDRQYGWRLPGSLSIAAE